MCPSFASGTLVKNPPASARDPSSTPGWGRASGVGNGNSLHYSGPENPKDRGVWWATVQGVANSRTRLSIAEHLYI